MPVETTKATSVAVKFIGWSSAAALATTSQPPPYIEGGISMAHAPHPSASYASSPPTGKAEMMMDERLIEAKLKLLESQTETKFATLIGKLDLLVQGVADVKSDLTRLDGKIEAVDGHARTGKREIITAIISSALAAIALGWAGVQIFQGGLGLSTSAFQAGMAAVEVEKNDNTQRGPQKGQD